RHRRAAPATARRPGATAPAAPPPPASPGRWCRTPRPVRRAPSPPAPPAARPHMAAPARSAPPREAPPARRGTAPGRRRPAPPRPPRPRTPPASAQSRPAGPTVAAVELTPAQQEVLTLLRDGDRPRPEVDPELRFELRARLEREL